MQPTSQLYNHKHTHTEQNNATIVQTKITTLNSQDLPEDKYVESIHDIIATINNSKWTNAAEYSDRLHSLVENININKLTEKGYLKLLQLLMKQISPMSNEEQRFQHINVVLDIILIIIKQYIREDKENETIEMWSFFITILQEYRNTEPKEQNDSLTEAQKTKLIEGFSAIVCFQVQDDHKFYNCEARISTYDYEWIKKCVCLVPENMRWIILGVIKKDIEENYRTDQENTKESAYESGAAKTFPDYLKELASIFEEQMVEHIKHNNDKLALHTWKRFVRHLIKLDKINQTNKGKHDLNQPAEDKWLHDKLQEGFKKLLDAQQPTNSNAQETPLAKIQPQTNIQATCQTKLSKDCIKFTQLNYKRKDGTLYRPTFLSLDIKKTAPREDRKKLDATRNQEHQNRLDKIRNYAKNNQNTELEALLKALQENQDTSTTTSHTSTATFPTHKVPYFNDARIQQYFLSQIDEFEKHGKIGGAPAMRAILNSTLPLLDKLKMLAAIGEGKSNNSRFSLSRASRSSEVAKFYQELRCFSALKESNQIPGVFEHFLKENGKVRKHIENLQQYIARYTLLEENLKLINLNSLSPRAKEDLTALKKIDTASSEHPEKVFIKIQDMQRFLIVYRKELHHAIATSVTADDGTSGFTTQFSHWIEFSKSTPENLRKKGEVLHDLSFIGVLPTPEELLYCCALIREYKKDPKNNAHDFIEALANVVLTANPETQKKLIIALTNGIAEGSEEAQDALNQVFYEAAKNNNKQLLKTLADALPNSTQATESMHSDSLLDIEADVQKYLIGEINGLSNITLDTNKFASGVSVPTTLGYGRKVASAEEMETILKSNLPLAGKLQLLARIRRAKKEDEYKRKVRLRSQETQDSYSILNDFDDMNATNVLEHYISFRLKTSKKNNNVTTNEIAASLQLIEENLDQIGAPGLQRLADFCITYVDGRQDLIQSYVKGVLEILTKPLLTEKEEEGSEFKIIFLNSLSTLLDKSYAGTISAILQCFPSKEHTTSKSPAHVTINEGTRTVIYKQTYYADPVSPKKPSKSSPTSMAKLFDVNQYLIQQLASDNFTANTVIISIIKSSLSVSEKFCLIAKIAQKAMTQSNFPSENKVLYTWLCQFYSPTMVTKELIRHEFIQLLKNQEKIDQSVTSLEKYILYYSSLQKDLQSLSPELVGDQKSQEELRRWQQPNVFRDIATVFDDIQKFRQFLQHHQKEIDAAVMQNQKNSSEAGLTASTPENSFVELFMQRVLLSQQAHQEKNLYAYLIPVKPTLKDIIECRQQITTILSDEKNKEKRKELINQLDKCYIPVLQQEKDFSGFIEKFIPFIAATQYPISLDQFQITLPELLEPLTVGFLQVYFKEHLKIHSFDHLSVEQKQVLILDFAQKIKPTTEKATSSQESNLIEAVSSFLQITLLEDVSGFDANLKEFNRWISTSIADSNQTSVYSVLRGLCTENFGEAAWEEIATQIVEKRSAWIGQTQGYALTQMINLLQSTTTFNEQETKLNARCAILSAVGSDRSSKEPLQLLQQNIWIGAVFSDPKDIKNFLIDPKTTVEQLKAVIEYFLKTNSQNIISLFKIFEEAKEIGLIHNNLSAFDYKTEILTAFKEQYPLPQDYRSEYKKIKKASDRKAFINCFATEQEEKNKLQQIFDLLKKCNQSRGLSSSFFSRPADGIQKILNIVSLHPEYTICDTLGEIEKIVTQRLDKNSVLRATKTQNVYETLRNYFDNPEGSTDDPFGLTQLHQNLATIISPTASTLAV